MRAAPGVCGRYPIGVKKKGGKKLVGTRALAAATAKPAKRRVPRNGVSVRPRAERQPAATQVLATRELFWHNVIREILTALSAQRAVRPPELPPGEADLELQKPGTPPRPAAPAEPDLFDGRLAVITQTGQRVAIADVFPLYACGIDPPGKNSLAAAVECTVFQIRTPGGEVYTLPLHEIRSFHALTPELMAKLERIERRRRGRQDGEGQEQHPFGFAAYTSLIRGTPDVLGPAPEHPTE